ncbi:MAG: hypothetical protein K2L89_01860, partial [Muribaculaceae bacterium]|nr:hypothetical protein [Muribaculaceae bacterium]
MKKIILILVFLLIGLSMHGYASENKTVVEGRYWNYLIEGMGGNTTSDNFRYAAKRFHFSGIRDFKGIAYNVFRDENEKEIAYLREENNKVYLYIGEEWNHIQGTVDITPGSFGYPSDDVTEVLLYDYSCTVGELFPCIGFDDRAGHFGIPFEGKVTAEGIISSGDYKYPYQDFMVKGSTEDNFIYGPFRNIEGIGNVRGLLPFPQFANLSSGLYWEKEYLMSVTDAEGNVIYKNNEIPNHSFLDTNLEWQYYEYYSSYKYNPLWRLYDYSLLPSDNPQYPYMWNYNNVREWQYVDDKGPEFQGESKPDSNEAYLREEDGVVYISLENYKVPKNFLVPYCEWNELHIYDPSTEEVPVYEPKPGEEVILYDFNAKVGDKYRTIIFGCLIVDATVTDVKQESYANLNLTEPIGEFSSSVKVVEILPDIKYILDHNVYGDGYKIRYAEKIGNISMGNFVSLQNELYPHRSDGSYYRCIINNIYKKNGLILYKG